MRGFQFTEDLGLFKGLVSSFVFDDMYIRKTEWCPRLESNQQPAA